MENNRNFRRRNAWLENRLAKTPESGNHPEVGHREALRMEPIPYLGELAPQNNLGEKMAENELRITKSDLQDLLSTLMKEVKSMNPLEQKKYDEEVAKDKRRAQMVVSLGRAEEEAMNQKKGRCSHCRWPAGSGKRSGEAAPRGQGEWCTGGQKHGDQTASLICGRCAFEWRFRPTPGEMDYLDNEGFMGFAPPSDDRLLSSCVDCSEYFTNKEMKEHECTRKPLAV